MLAFKLALQGIVCFICDLSVIPLIRLIRNQCLSLMLVTLAPTMTQCVVSSVCSYIGHIYVITLQRCMVISA